jgi:hypothetical protein
MAHALPSQAGTWVEAVLPSFGPVAHAAQPLGVRSQWSSSMSLADYLASLADEEDDAIEGALAMSAEADNRNVVDEALANWFDE